MNVLSRTLWTKRDNVNKQKINVNKYVGFHTTLIERIPSASRDRICFLPLLSAAAAAATGAVDDDTFTYAEAATAPVLKPLEAAIGSAKAAVMQKIAEITLQKEKDEQERQRALQENQRQAAERQREAEALRALQRQQEADAQRRKQEEEERLRKERKAAERARPVVHQHVYHGGKSNECVLM